VAIVHLLLLLLLWTLAPDPFHPPERKAAPLEIRFVPPSLEGSSSAAAPGRDVPESGVSKARTEEVLPPPPAPVPPPPAVVPPESSSLKLLEGLEDFDLAKIPRGTKSSGGNAFANQGNGAGQGAGDGPGGERLYAAQWQRKPSPAEISGYLPRGRRQSGWGEIACRTVENYRVEDCRELGQWPAGSGLAGVVRQAAWQFRVHPPRVGGRPLVGAWVRIHIDFHETSAD
jgi:protein TonB